MLEKNLDTLEDAVKGILTGFKRKRHTRFQGPTISPLATVSTSYLLGEPLSIDDSKQDRDAIKALAEVLLGMENGIVQISATPKRSSERALKSLEKQYKSATESSQLTVSTPQSTLFSGEVQRSTTSINPEYI